MHYHELKIARIAMMEQVKTIMASDDEKKTIKACIGIRVLGKLKPFHLEDLLNMLSSMLPCENAVFSKFLTYILAKFCRRNYLKDLSFIANELSRCTEWLSSNNENNEIENALNLLEWFAQFASSALLSSSQQFLDSLEVGLFHRDLNVRFRSKDIINNFLERSRKSGPIILTVFQTALRLLDAENMVEKHGALLVLSIYAERNPELFTEEADYLMKTARELITHNESFISISALRLIVALAPLDPVEFRCSHSEIITNFFWQSPKPQVEMVSSLIRLLKHIPDVFANNDHRIFTLLRVLFSMHSEDCASVGLHLLETVYQVLPNIFSTRLVEVSGIICSSPFIESFVIRVTPLFHSSSALWSLSQKNIGKRLITSLKEANCVIPLRIIAECPDFNDSIAQALLLLVKPLLNSEVPEIRKHTPAALLSLFGDIYDEKFEDMVNNILALAVSETIIDIRLSILESLKAPYSPYLSFPKALDLLSVLVNDESFRVRKTTLNILGSLVVSDPAIVLPIFRRVLLDALFICDSSPLLKLQAQTTRCFPIILNSCSPILPVYVPVFIPIAMDYLRNRLCPRIDTSHEQKQQYSQQTIFEQQYSVLIAVNFIDSIALMCQIQTKLLTPSFKEIADLLIEILASNTHKLIAVSALTALMYIIDYMGTNASAQFPSLLQTLFNIGSNFSSWKVHAAVFKVYGRFGASLPLNNLIPTSLAQEEPANFDVSLINNQISTNEWSIYVVSNAIQWILDDELQSSLHFQALQILTEAFPLGSEFSRPFFNQYISKLFQMLRLSAPDEKEQYFLLLKKNVEIHPTWMKDYAHQCAKLIEEYRESQFLSYALDLIPVLSEFLEEAFAPYIPQIVTSLLDSLFNNESAHQYVVKQILDSLSKLSSFASDFVFIILRQTVEIIFNPTTSPTIVITALEALIRMSLKYDCSSYSSLLVRSCFLCFSNQNENVRLSSVRLLLTLSNQIGPRFSSYISRAEIQLKSSGLYTDSIAKLLSSPSKLVFLENNKKHISESCKNSVQQPYTIDNFSIITSALCEPTFTTSQWKDWCRGLSLTLISQSPWMIVRKCHGLAQSCFGFSMKLFHAAFLSCWVSISESARYVLGESISQALVNTETPMSVLTTIVSLVEFMEKNEHHLNIPFSNLAKAALRAEKIPFALFCAQQDLLSPKLSISAVEMLLKIFSQLGLEDDVRGLIHYLRTNTNIEMTPKFAEQLGDWQTAIQLYTDNINNNEAFLGLLASYSMVSKWDTISEHFQRFEDLPATIKAQTAQIFADAFCHLGDWTRFEIAIKHCPQDSIESIITQCLANHKRGLPFNHLIERGFDELGMRAGSLFPHGFSSLIPFLIQAEQLVEIAEIPNKPLWSMRTKVPHLSYQQVQPLFLLRIQLLGVNNAENEILSMLKLARNSGEWELHDGLFDRFFSAFDPHISSLPVVLEYSLSLWKRQQKNQAVEVLTLLVDRLDLENDDSSLIERAQFLQARWLVRSDDSENEVSALKKAADICSKARTSQKATLLWAWTQTKLYNMKEGDRSQAAINAIKAFIECASGISEMMQLCSIAFRAGKFSEVFDTVEADLLSLNTELWLHMIPQLFAQLHNPVEKLRVFATTVIRKCLIEHHYAVVFSLLFSIGMNDQGSVISKALLNEFALINPDVVGAATIVYGGLLNACTTKAEMWLENLNLVVEEFKQGNINEMRLCLDKVFSSLKVISSDADLYFNRLFGDKISSMQQPFKRYFVTKNKNDLVPVWNEYRVLCQNIKSEIETMTSIPMRFVAPKLSDLVDIDIAVPGKYLPGSQPITIYKFSSSLDVFPSKQRPKRLAIIGSDGCENWYLLKGHEDLRLDQRVVQVFHLINSFIPESMPKIITNFIMPLSPNVGLIQWIPGSDTMFKLIREHRSARNVPLDLESKIISQLTTPRCDDLLPIMRLEAFGCICNETPDTVLSDIMWLKAPDAESWVKRVSMFSRTSAIMSVVGYILGLGDRHPSNLMIHKFSGSVIHVDFGDCFEITKQRVLFPELIPFRLTRFMIRAFGPSGVNGSFLKTCLDTVKLIRRKREGIMSVLEIFAHAPLVRTGNLSKPNKYQGDSNMSLDTSLLESDVIKTINRISDKINGRDFDFNYRLTQGEQVNQLINAATDSYNLSHLYHGWYPLW